MGIYWNDRSRLKNEISVDIYVAATTAWHPATSIVREKRKITIAAIAAAKDRNIQTIQSMIVANQVNVCKIERFNILWV